MAEHAFIDLTGDDDDLPQVTNDPSYHSPGRVGAFNNGHNTLSELDYGTNEYLSTNQDGRYIENISFSPTFPKQPSPQRAHPGHISIPVPPPFNSFPMGSPGFYSGGSHLGTNGKENRDGAISGLPSVPTRFTRSPSLSTNSITNGASSLSLGPSPSNVDARAIIDLTNTSTPPPTRARPQAFIVHQPAHLAVSQNSWRTYHPPPQQASQPHGMMQPPMGSLMSEDPKRPACIGQLASTALILYPIPYLSMDPTNFNGANDWVSVRLKFDPAMAPSMEQTIHISSPPSRAPTGELIPGDQFGVVETKISSVLGPLMGERPHKGRRQSSKGKSGRK